MNIREWVLRLTGVEKKLDAIEEHMITKDLATLDVGEEFLKSRQTGIWDLDGVYGLACMRDVMTVAFAYQRIRVHDNTERNQAIYQQAMELTEAYEQWFRGWRDKKEGGDI